MYQMLTTCLVLRIQRDRKQVGSNCLVGMGFSLRVMKMLWN